MREIKFRAWHKANKKYYKVSCIEFDNKYAWHIDDLEVVDGDDKIDLGFSFDEVIIEQYTGIIDKNNKEICEGDVIRLEVEDRWQDSTLVVDSIFDLGNIYGGWLASDHFVTNVEIVGNIHESEK